MISACVAFTSQLGYEVKSRGYLRRLRRGPNEDRRTSLNLGAVNQSTRRQRKKAGKKDRTKTNGHLFTTHYDLGIVINIIIPITVWGSMGCQILARKKCCIPEVALLVLRFF
jgi:hypothetical protein